MAGPLRTAPPEPFSCRSRLDRDDAFSAGSCATAHPARTSACVHMIRSGTSTWRSSILPRGRLGQERTERQAGLRADERGPAPPELPSDAPAGEPAAEDQDPGSGRPRGGCVAGTLLGGWLRGDRGDVRPVRRVPRSGYPSPDPETPPGTQKSVTVCLRGNGPAGKHGPRPRAELMVREAWEA
jgi:hypothetical protein